MTTAEKKVVRQRLSALQLPEPDMFLTQEDIIREAYRIQGDRFAYKK